jgi:LytS/YehU family sensor histidine kinase
VLVLVGSVLLFFRLRENRIRKEEARQTAINKQIAEIKMMALRSQMNPHFIFNSLNSIQHFITTHEKEEALHYLSKFSKLIRKILENSRQNTVSVSNELELLKLYIQLEQLRSAINLIIILQLMKRSILKIQRSLLYLFNLY